MAEFVQISKSEQLMPERYLGTTDKQEQGIKCFSHQKKQSSTEEAQQRLLEWNNTQVHYPLHQCVHQLFEAQVKCTPKALAIASQEGTLTYEELNQKANQVARYLQHHGVGPEVLVGLCVKRSLNMVIGMLGTLKAGAAYVPFDISYPNERISYMLRDSRISFLMTEQTFVMSTAQTEFITVLYLDTDWSRVSQEDTHNVESEVNAGNRMYVVYTSGSTGRPKGVEITHKSMLNLIFWHQHAFKVTAVDRAAQISSPAFDATGWELWPYLSIGASIHLVDETARFSPIVLRDWLLNNAITITFLPTILAESMLTLDWPASTRLRILLTGADVLHHYPAIDLPFTLVNNYGPSEATVLVTSGYVDQTTHATTAPTIGRAIDNTQIYILDENLHEVPIGTIGEIYIAGAGLAKGYLNRPELTAEKFIMHSFDNQSQVRLYKTGDTAYYLPDGQIMFAGRHDLQVKIRGFRIELGEIETVLSQHPGIIQAAVIAQEEMFYEKRLVAYLVIKQISIIEIQNFLHTQLPDYMIPQTFIVLDALPLTAHGKVDRNALSALYEEHTMQDQNVMQSVTPLEAKIADIIATLLHLEQIEMDDNFFMLGGQSLLGTQIITEVARFFGVYLPLRALFHAPTVRQLSTVIEEEILAKVLAMSEEEVQLSLIQKESI